MAWSGKNTDRRLDTPLGRDRTPLRRARLRSGYAMGCPGGGGKGGGTSTHDQNTTIHRQLLRQASIPSCAWTAPHLRSALTSRARISLRAIETARERRDSGRKSFARRYGGGTVLLSDPTRIVRPPTSGRFCVDNWLPGAADRLRSQDIVPAIIRGLADAPQFLGALNDRESFLTGGATAQRFILAERYVTGEAEERRMRGLPVLCLKHSLLST